MSVARRLATLGLAAAAFGYLVAMALTGANPVQRQLVPFEANGVLKSEPERVRRVELARGSERLALVRTGDKRWARADGAELDEDTGKRISMAVQMMHTSAPVRVIAAEELEDVDPAGFELDPPRVVASLYGAEEGPVLTVRFGGRNPDGFLQYMKMDGDPGIYLMSRFVGEAWSEALERIAQR